MNEAVPPPLSPHPHPPASTSTYVPQCEACRVTGTVGLAAISAWLLRERTAVERGARGHRAVLVAMSAGFAVAAVARWRA